MAKVYDPNFSKDTIYDEETYKQVVKKYENTTDFSGIMRLYIRKEPVKGVVYLGLDWQILSPKRGMGIFTVFSAEGIPIRNIPKMGDLKDARAENEGLRLAWSFEKTKCGVFGEAMSIFGKAWLQEAARLQEECKNKSKKDTTQADAGVRSAKICQYVRTHYSEKNLEHAGELLSDENIPFKLDFGTFPENHPYGQKGAPKIELYDARTKKGNVAGKSFASYSLATIPRPQANGTVINEPITPENIHEFITRGSRVILQKHAATSPTASQFGFALKNVVLKAVILPGSSGTPEDEKEEEEMDEIITTSVKNLTIVNETKSATTEEIADDLLEELI
jgi:hypothetical protein